MATRQPSSRSRSERSSRRLSGGSEITKSALRGGHQRMEATPWAWATRLISALRLSASSSPDIATLHLLAAAPRPAGEQATGRAAASKSLGFFDGWTEPGRGGKSARGGG